MQSDLGFRSFGLQSGGGGEMREQGWKRGDGQEAVSAVQMVDAVCRWQWWSPCQLSALTPASHQSRRHTGSQILKKYIQKPYHPESILLRTTLRSWQRKTIYLTKPTGNHVENINWLLHSPTTMFCWERLKAGGEGDDRGWGGFMASLTQWTWVWVNSGSWWWTGKPGVLRSMGSQSRTQLNGWTELMFLSG